MNIKYMKEIPVPDKLLKQLQKLYGRYPSTPPTKLAKLILGKYVSPFIQETQQKIFAQTNKIGDNILMWAIRYDRELAKSILEEYIYKFDEETQQKIFSQKNELGDNLLMSAIRYDRELAELLLKKYIYKFDEKTQQKIFSVKNTKTANAMMLAAAFQPEILELMLEKLSTWADKTECSQILLDQNNDGWNIAMLIACFQPEKFKVILNFQFKNPELFNEITWKQMISAKCEEDWNVLMFLRANGLFVVKNSVLKDYPTLLELAFIPEHSVPFGDRILFKQLPMKEDQDEHTVKLDMTLALLESYIEKNEQPLLTTAVNKLKNIVIDLKNADKRSTSPEQTNKFQEMPSLLNYFIHDENHLLLFSICEQLISESKRLHELKNKPSTAKQDIKQRKLASLFGSKTSDQNQNRLQDQESNNDARIPSGARRP